MKISQTHFVLLVALLVSGLILPGAMPVFAQESTPQADDRESRSFLFHPADTGLLTVFEAEINAGESADLTVLLGNNGSVTQDLRMYTVNVFTGESGGMVADEYGAELNPVSQWVNFPEEVITLESGEGIERTFTVTVPEGTPSGEYIAAVAGEHADDLEIEGDASFRQKLRYIAPIFIRVPGEMTPAFSFGEPQLELADDVLVIHLPISNDGNMHLMPSGEITLRDQAGNIILTTPVSVPPIYARESATISIGITGGLTTGQYQLEGSFSDAATGATATIAQATFEATVAATPVPAQYRFDSASVTPGPAVDNVQFVTVQAVIFNNGDPATGVQLSLVAYLDGEEVERFPINQSLSLPTGETPITTRYIPATGFTSGEWTFELLLETVTPGGAAVVAARIEIETTIEVP
jgi:hypothetical protein